MTRVFLDANVLFSAAWRTGCGLTRLWHIESNRLVTSPYAANEAERNLARKRSDARRKKGRGYSRDVAMAPPASRTIVRRLRPRHLSGTRLAAPQKSCPFRVEPVAP